MIRRISTKLLLAVLAAVVLPFLGFTLFVNSAMAERLSRDVVVFSLESLAADLAGRIDRRIEQCRSDVALLAGSEVNPWAIGEHDAERAGGERDDVFRQLLEQFPRHRYAERASWKVGWEAYRRQKFAETIKLFESAAVTFPRADYRPGWVYWSGRARDRMGDASGAAARYRLAVIDYGNSYYGRLASRLLVLRAGSA